ncbi:MAG: Ca2+-dependent phosphoinositide-specific phospholipase C, partial [Leptospirales bacterium]
IKDTGALRYNQVQQKSSHNSFSRDEGILDQLVFHRLRSIEFDIYRGKLGRPGINNDWYVYHTPIIDTGTSCDKLSACFGELRAFDRMHPDHEVTTVWFDIKDGWGGTQNPNTFDALVRQYFSDDDILKPADLLAACPGASNLKQAITGSCAWPTLNSLKGKWIFVLVAGGYSGDRVGFTPGGTGSIAAVDASSSVFYNQGSQDNNVSNYIYNQGFVSRRYVLDDANGFNSAIAGNIHHIATNRINYRRDGWSKTHNALGWPFRCLVACDVFAEAETVLGIEVNSEDIWGRDDHFAFAYQDRGGANGRWIASVTGASSHIDQWAKGCLMARANTASNSPYFAVCRPGDNRRIRIQWRDNFGNNSGASETNINHAGGLDQPNLTFMKMDVYDNGRCAAGFGSPDGERWTSIGSRCFNHTLALQGASGSSHGNVGVRHLFSNLTYWDVVQRRSSFDVRRIGTVRSEKVFDGSFDTPGAVNLYDLGTATSPLFKGYRRLDAGRPFSGRSFGWTDTSGNQERDRGAGAGNRINRDLVFNSQPRTFEQIVPNGDWYAMI